LFFEEDRMSSRRQDAEAAAGRIAQPILASLGLELIEVALTGPARAPVLRFAADRPGGGVTVDELQAASRSLELALEVAGVVAGRYQLEVTSPGIDRPWKTLADFRRHVGDRAALKLFAPLPDGRRHLQGRLAGVEGESIAFAPDAGEPVSIPLANVASARPEVDWAALLRGERTPPRGGHAEGAS
jgi:ribosome maturation factor RimP